MMPQEAIRRLRRNLDELEKCFLDHSVDVSKGFDFFNRMTTESDFLKRELMKINRKQQGTREAIEAKIREKAVAAIGEYATACKRLVEAPAIMITAPRKPREAKIKFAEFTL